MTSRPLPRFPPHPYLARNERLREAETERERRLRGTLSWRGNVKMRQTLREKGRGGRMKRNLASTATEAGSPLFLVSSHPIYKITLLERPSLRKRRETTLSQTFPRQSIAVTRYPWPCVPPLLDWPWPPIYYLFSFFPFNIIIGQSSREKTQDANFFKAREREREKSSVWKIVRVKKYRIRIFCLRHRKFYVGFYSLWGFELATVGFASSKDYHYATDVTWNSFLFQVIAMSLWHIL